MAPSPGGRRSSKGGFDLFIILAIVLFVASAALAAGVFLYLQFLETSAQSKLEQLNRAKAAFEPTLIAELTRLDDRMRAADEVLGNHIAPSALFLLLEKLTLQTVSFTTLDFSSQNSTDMTLAMQGVAKSVNSIALEADLLSKSGVITNPIFSNINRQLGGVRFDFTAKLNAESLRYRNVLQGSLAEPGAPVETELPVSNSPFDVPAETQSDAPAESESN